MRTHRQAKQARVNAAVFLIASTILVPFVSGFSGQAGMSAATALVRHL